MPDNNSLLQSSEADLMVVSDVPIKIYNGSEYINVDNERDIISLKPKAITKLTAGSNVQIDETIDSQGNTEYTISASGGGSTYQAGEGITISDDVISADLEIIASHTDVSNAISSANEYTDNKIAAIIASKFYVTPDDYGAKGDNTTDDTAAWTSMLADTSDKAKTILLPNNKRYKIDFTNFTLQNRTILGVNKNNCGITQKNSNVPFCTIGSNAELGNFTFVAGNNTTLTAFINFGLTAGGTFMPFIGAYVHDLHGYCVANVVAIDFKYASSGSYNIRIERCKFDNPGIGLRIKDVDSGIVSTTSYITNFEFKDILISAPYQYGYCIDKSQAGGKTISHGSMIDCSVQLDRANTVGFKLGYSNINLYNPTCFLETGTNSGTAYSLELDFLKARPANIVSDTTNIFGGLLEGYIKNKEFIYFIKCFNTNFVEEPNFAYNLLGERSKTRHNSTEPISVLHVHNNDIFDNATLSNCTKSVISDKFGYTTKLICNDTEQPFMQITYDVANLKSSIVTALVGMYFSNNYTWRTSGESFSIPFMYFTDGSNSVYSYLGTSIAGNYGKITGSLTEDYQIVEDIFDITTLDKTLLKLVVNIPTAFISNNATDYVSVIGLQIYENFFLNTLSIKDLEQISNNAFVQKYSMMSQSQLNNNTIHFEFGSSTQTQFMFLTFTFDEITTNADDIVNIVIKSGNTTVNTFRQSVIVSQKNTFTVTCVIADYSSTITADITTDNNTIVSGTYNAHCNGMKI